MIQNDDWQELLKFIAEMTSCDIKSLSEGSLIEDDLGVTGDDAIDLIEKFGLRFNVIVTDFKFEDYFFPEPGMFGNRESKKIKPLTIGDLNKAIARGRLDDSVIGKV